MWFYDHTTRYKVYEKRTFPRIASWAKVYHGGRYVALELARQHCEVCVVIVLHMKLCSSDPYDIFSCEITDKTRTAPMKERAT